MDIEENYQETNMMKFQLMQMDYIMNQQQSRNLMIRLLGVQNRKEIMYGCGCPKK